MYRFRMNTSNAFGIVQAVVDLVMQYKAPGAEEEEEEEDGASFAGKFLLLKEPSKSMIRLYAVVIIINTPIYEPRVYCGIYSQITSVGDYAVYEFDMM